MNQLKEVHRQQMYEKDTKIKGLYEIIDAMQDQIDYVMSLLKKSNKYNKISKKDKNIQKNNEAIIEKIQTAKQSPCRISSSNQTLTKAGTIQSSKSQLRSNTGDLEQSLIASVQPAEN